MPTSDNDEEVKRKDKGRPDEEEDFELITISSPIGGLYDIGNIFQVAVNGLSLSQNVTFENLALEKRPGLKEVGQKLTDSIRGNWGGQYVMPNDESPPVEQLTMLRANGVFSLNSRLFKLVDWESTDPDDWRWKGVISNTEQGTSADNIGDGFGYATVIVQAGRMYYADGGGARKVFIFSPKQIVTWGLNVTTPAAGTIASESSGGTGYLLTGRKYSYKYQIISELTGFKSQLSAESNVFETTLAGDNVALAGVVPAQAGLASGTYTVRIARSTGSVPPSPPAAWLFEKDYTGITNLATVPLNVTLEKFDGDLTQQLTEVYPTAPRGKYVLYDPSGDRAILFGDPENLSVVYWSEDGNFGNWPPVQQTPPIEDDNGDPLNGGFVGLNGRVFIMKRRKGVYELVQTVNGAYSPQKLTNAYGCWSHYSIVNRGTSLYWLTLEGAVEFNGSEFNNISDDKIRRLFETFAKAESEAIEFLPPYGIDQRKPGLPTIEWVVRDPTTNGEYRMIYNVRLKNWSLQSSESGIGYSVQWLARDAQPGIGDGLDHLYISAADGSLRRYGSDMNANVIYYDEQDGIEREYTWNPKTVWFGNGIESYIPRYLDFLMKVVPEEEANGQIVVSLYVDGHETPQHQKPYPIPNSTDYPDVQFVPVRFRCDSHKSPCRIFRFGWAHFDADGHPMIPLYQIKYSLVEPRLRGIRPHG